MSGWTAIVPVKSWELAKSRLSVPGLDRALVARAMSMDTLQTLHDSDLVERVVVVTAEPGVAALAAALPATVVRQERSTSVSDTLNPAVRHGRAWVHGADPDTRVVVVPSDLAAMAVGPLDDALALLALHERAHVPDLGGTGTTLLAAARPSSLHPRYGTESAHEHGVSGSVPVAGVDGRIRLDVDDAEDLERAARMGLAPHVDRLVRASPRFRPLVHR